MAMKTMSPTLAKDVYKEFHKPAYHPDVTRVFSNFINRNGKHSNVPNNKRTANFGLQFHIIDFLINDWQDSFFNTPKDAMSKKHKRILSAMLGYEVPTEHLEALHDLGYLPLEIRALPEGVMVPYGVPTYTVENTNDDFAWLTNSIETAMSADVWPMQTAATTAINYLKNFMEYDKATGGNGETCKFQAHDFSMRGLMFRDGSKLGLAHLAVGNCGTDTIPAVVAAEEWYGADVDKELVGASVNATEHSVTCSWQEEGEKTFYEYLMKEVAPTGILSLVFDTWDFWNGVTEILPEMKDMIMSRDGKVVIRPDSGDPVRILTGYFADKEPTLVDGMVSYTSYQDGRYDSVLIDGKYYEIFHYSSEGNRELYSIGAELEEHEVRGLVQCLWDTFGGTEQKGASDVMFKVLDSHIGCIYGDSITLERQLDILYRLTCKGFASSNVVLGVGSYTYQYVTRDTHGSAIKATNIVKNGKDVAIFKDPKTDPGKKSAKGLTMVIKGSDGEYHRVDEASRELFESGENELKVVFRNGVLLKRWTLAQVRENFMKEIEAGRVS